LAFSIFALRKSQQNKKTHLFTAIDCSAKFVVYELFNQAATKSAKKLLETVIAAVPYRIHTVLSNNGIQRIGAATDTFGGLPFDCV
jgi:hypothetical protein